MPDVLRFVDIPADLPTRTRRRIWRLAFLLAGGRTAALRVLLSMLRDRRNPASLDLVHLDRMILQHTRGALGDDPPRQGDVAGPAPSSNPGVTIWHTLLTLRRQPIEAWILTRVEGLDELHVARAMDCSKTAAGRFLQTADTHLAQHLDDVRVGTKALRQIAMHLDADGAIAKVSADLRRRARERFARRSLPMGVLGLLVLVVLLHVL